jgi:hypothetical protein
VATYAAALVFVCAGVLVFFRSWLSYGLGGPMNWVGSGADGRRSIYVRGEVLQSEPPKL